MENKQETTLEEAAENFINNDLDLYESLVDGHISYNIGIDLLNNLFINGAKWQKEQYTIEEQHVGHTIDELSKEYIKGFNEGSAWQQERSYSEEDMKRAFKVGFSIGYGSPVNGLDSKDETCEVWFEQFKNK